MTDFEDGAIVDADIVQLGHKAGVAARAELELAGTTSTAMHSWLFGFLSGFARPGRTGTEPARAPRSQARRAPVLPDGPKPINTARVHRVSAASLSGTETVSLVTLDVEGLGLAHSPGDELNVIPSNSPDTVRDVLRQLAAQPQSRVVVNMREVPAWQALLETVRIDVATPEVLELMCRHSRSRDERAALETMLAQGADQPLSLIGVLRRFPANRPALDDLLQCLAPLTGACVPIAGALEEGSLSILTRAASSRKGYGSLAEETARNCREGAWLSFSICPYEQPIPTLEPLIPLVMVCDDLGAAVARSLLLRRLHHGHKGRNWLIGVGSLGSRNPALVDMTEWGDSQLCRRTDFLVDEASGLWSGSARITETLWRWLVDKSSLCIAIAESAVRDEFRANLVRSIAARARVTEQVAKERLDSWTRAGQVFEWHPGGVGDQELNADGSTE